MNKEYIFSDGKLLVTNEKGKIEKRNIDSNIDEILAYENDVEFLDESIVKKERYLKTLKERIKLNHKMIMLTLPVSTAFFGLLLPILTFSTDMIGVSLLSGSLIGASGYLLFLPFNSNLKKDAKRVNKIIEVANEEREIAIKKLEEAKTKVNIKVNQEGINKVSDNVNEISSKLDLTDTYGYIEKKLKKEKKKGNLDTYLSNIGCTEDQKRIFLELLSGSIENEKTEEPKIYIKR